MKRLYFALVLALAGPLAAQDSTATSTASLNVFLDCNSFEACDFDFHRTEITMVNWVRDRQVADVHILVTTQGTGSGGTQYTVSFIGLRRFEGMVDTLTTTTQPAATADEKRRELARLFRLGLVRFIARTPGASRLTIGVSGASDAAQTTPGNDPWRAWVFRASLNSYMDGEETYNAFSLHGNVNADRITEQWKTRINAYESYNESNFEIDDSTTVVNIQRRYGGSMLQARSLGPQWSAGLRLDASSSTYDNFKRVFGVWPAIEYNFFPYSESTRRQIRLEYNIGYSDFVFRDTTIRDKVREGMPMHRLRMAAASRQQWGSVDVEIQAVNYLNQTSMYNIGTYGDVSLRLFKGFNLNIFGNYNIIEDQFYLAKKDFTPEEILTRQFQRGTTYRYFAGVGLSYTFGSIFNNVVNPRFGGGF